MGNSGRVGLILVDGCSKFVGGRFTIERLVMVYVRLCDKCGTTQQYDVKFEIPPDLFERSGCPVCNYNKRSEEGYKLGFLDGLKKGFERALDVIGGVNWLSGSFGREIILRLTKARDEQLKKFAEAEQFQSICDKKKEPITCPNCGVNVRDEHQHRNLTNVFDSWMCVDERPKKPKLVPHYPATVEDEGGYHVTNYVFVDVEDANRNINSGCCKYKIIRLATEYPPVMLPKK